MDSAIARARLILINAVTVFIVPRPHFGVKGTCAASLQFPSFQTANLVGAGDEICLARDEGWEASLKALGPDWEQVIGARRYSPAKTSIRFRPDSVRRSRSGSIRAP